MMIVVTRMITVMMVSLVTARVMTHRWDRSYSQATGWSRSLKTVEIET